MLRLAAGAALLALFGVGSGAPAGSQGPTMNGASLSAVARAYLHAEQRGDDAAETRSPRPTTATAHEWRQCI
jgi:H+/Cl- antiporter ClcA